ncbi:Dolichyl-diphosphooligosaccharide--protein glycosyltransferase subunit 2 [Aphelenchoides avenae]|nr:Dolichyl-diphosphooligosaccharide--protein glycosyltransferase subunit 2 [Aphelenchus avenae]
MLSQKLTSYLCFAFLCLISSCAAGQAPSKSAPEVKTTRQITVTDVEFATYERDLQKPVAPKPLAQGSKLKEVPRVDSHQKVQLKFAVKDAQNAGITVHQAFVALVHKDTQREVIYVAEPAKETKLYTFELDMSTNAKDFAGVNGQYALRLILGDASVTNPVDWNFADISVVVPEEPAQPVKKSQQIIYNKLPEITHQFREQETRPPVIVSDVFSVVCLLPALLLFVLWLRVGINFGNIQISLWALGFHVGLAAIFGLYFLFWLKLNMFATLKYLALVGVPTFVCGHRLLHGIAVSKQKKVE